VAVGFPDILFEPPDAFVHLINRQETTEADVVLGLFPTDRPDKMDMVRTTDEGRVTEIVIKPESSDLRYSWSITVWKPTFTSFMHDLLQRVEAKLAAENGELHLGMVIQSALQAGLSVDSVKFPAGRCLDIGTPDDLQRAMQEQLQER
jgi:glucose-1-phosphate thymidylyltransferase